MLVGLVAWTPQWCWRSFEVLLLGAEALGYHVLKPGIALEKVYRVSEHVLLLGPLKWGAPIYPSTHP